MKRLGGELDGKKKEAGVLETRVAALRERHRSESERCAREARRATAELEGLRSEEAEVRSKLRDGRGELLAVAAAAEDRAAAVDAAETAAASLERRAAELGAQVEGLESARDRVAEETEAARRRQAEELSRWKEATAERQQEFERFSRMVRTKASSLGDLEKEVRWWGGWWSREAAIRAKRESTHALGRYEYARAGRCWGVASCVCPTRAAPKACLGRSYCTFWAARPLGSKLCPLRELRVTPSLRQNRPRLCPCVISPPLHTLYQFCATSRELDFYQLTQTILHWSAC